MYLLVKQAQRTFYLITEIHLIPSLYPSAHLPTNRSFPILQLQPFISSQLSSCHGSLLNLIPRHSQATSSLHFTFSPAVQLLPTWRAHYFTSCPWKDTKDFSLLHKRTSWHMLLAGNDSIAACHHQKTEEHIRIKKQTEQCILLLPFPPATRLVQLWEPEGHQ